VRRLHLVELEDLPAFPAGLRDLVTEALAFFERLGGVPDPIAPLVRRLLAASDTRQVVDLCAGAGGPMAALAPGLAAEGVGVVFTDLFPNQPALTALARAHPGVRVLDTPVDARAVPASLRGVRTVCTAFHHFAPADAETILRTAVEARQPIGLFEVAERRAFTMALAPLVALAQLATAPWQRPWRWRRLALTYLVPLVPFVLAFDGTVSCLRAYRVDELLALAHRAGGGPDWRWEAGRIRVASGLGHVVYLLGHPTRAGGDGGSGA
jgi:hypothetical protein